MVSPARTSPVKDTIPKIENELAVGEDLEFQRRWWRFERIVWVVFAAIIVLDLIGVLGRGPLAHARTKTADGAMNMTYDRFLRFQTPSIITIHFGRNALQGGKVQLWVGDSLVDSLGNQRIIPQPASSVLQGHGILYTWPSGNEPDSVSFALEPAHPGVQHFIIRLPALNDQIGRAVFVYP
jgi:hypothetical protein